MAGKKLTIGSNAASIPKPRPLGAIRGFPKGPRPRPPGKLPGRPKPIAVTKPPVAPVTKPPVGPDFNSWFKTDPRWFQQSPMFEAARAGTYGQYGMSPMIGADGKPVIGANGKPRYNIASAAEAPFTMVNQLAQAFAGKSQNIQDSANSRGLLFSGAQAQGQQNALTEKDRQTSDMVGAFERALQGINQDEADLITSLYPDYLATAPPATPATTAAAATPAATSAAAAAKEKDRQARIKKAQDHLRQDKLNAKKRKPPKKTTTSKKATIGSSANSMRSM